MGAAGDTRHIAEVAAAAWTSPRWRASKCDAMACRKRLEIQAILDLLRPELGYEIEVRCHRMRNWLICVLTAIAITACAGNSAVTKRLERYRILSAEPTPADWQAGAVWTFVTIDRSGNKDTLTFRVSNAEAQTCTSGDWRALELLEGEVGSLGEVPSKPAALVEGRNLRINLTSNWCDVDNDLKGELLGSTFTGKRTVGGPTGSTLIGEIQGWRVK